MNDGKEDGTSMVEEPGKGPKEKSAVTSQKLVWSTVGVEDPVKIFVVVGKSG